MLSWFARLVTLGLLAPALIQGCEFNSDDLVRFVQQRMESLSGNNTVDKCATLVANSTAPDSKLYPTVKVFLFHHEEPELLTDWIQYHGYLFGLQNLHVIDHGSADEDICRSLALYKACGMVVEDFRLPFREKSAALSKMMSRYSDAFLVPLDTDEFIVRPIRSSDDPKDRRGLKVGRSDILEVFKSLPRDGKKYKFHESYLVAFDEETCQQSLQYADHRQPNYRRVMNHGYFLWTDTLPPPVRKTFYWSKGFISTDQGNHHGQVANDGQHVSAWSDAVVKAHPEQFFHLFTNLSLLHYGFSSYYGQKIKYIRGAEAYGIDADTNCTTVKLGQPYCLHAQHFRQDNEHAHRKYMGMCTAPAKFSASTHVLRNWFRKNTLSVRHILGYPPLKEAACQ